MTDEELIARFNLEYEKYLAKLSPAARAKHLEAQAKRGQWTKFKRRRRALESRIVKLSNMTVARGAAEAEAAFAAQRMYELATELVTLRPPGSGLPSHVPRPSKVKKPGRRVTPVPTLQRPVKEWALLQRINRALPKGQTVRVARGKKVETRGQFYLAQGEEVLIGNVDIEALARKLGVLSLSEKLQDEFKPVKGRPRETRERRKRRQEELDHKRMRGGYSWLSKKDIEPEFKSKFGPILGGKDAYENK